MPLQFDLVCKRQPEAAHASSLYLLGGMVAAPIITPLSDLYGRRAAFLIPLYLAVICNVLCALAPNYSFFLVFRFLSGFGYKASDSRTEEKFSQPSTWRGCSGRSA